MIISSIIEIISLTPSHSMTKRPRLTSMTDMNHIHSMTATLRFYFSKKAIFSRSKMIKPPSTAINKTPMNSILLKN